MNGLTFCRDPSNKSFPKYSDTPVNKKGCHMFRNLLKGVDVKMSQVLWEVGLREENKEYFNKRIKWFINYNRIYFSIHRMKVHGFNILFLHPFPLPSLLLWLLFHSLNLPLICVIFSLPYIPTAFPWYKKKIMFVIMFRFQLMPLDTFINSFSLCCLVLHFLWSTLSLLVFTSRPSSLTRSWIV